MLPLLSTSSDCQTLGMPPGFLRRRPRPPFRLTLRAPARTSRGTAACPAPHALSPARSADATQACSAFAGAAVCPPAHPPRVPSDRTCDDSERPVRRTPRLLTRACPRLYSRLLSSVYSRRFTITFPQFRGLKCYKTGSVLLKPNLGKSGLGLTRGCLEAPLPRLCAARTCAATDAPGCA